MSKIKVARSEIKRKVAIIIPCYRAKLTIDSVVQDCLKYLNKMLNLIDYKIIIIDDACPNLSCRNIEENKLIKLIRHEKNCGVGASTLTGINFALKNNFDLIIKLDADGQHPPKYLVDLIPFIISLPRYQLFLTKGTRYKINFSKNKVPFARKLGTMFLDPIARSALNYRGLSDVTNGFLGMDSNTAKFLLKNYGGTKIESRYLFESSLLAKCSELGIKLNEFHMLPYYGEKWLSSMNAFSMIFPLIIFWLKIIFRRIFRKYLFNFNLGTLLLSISILNFIFCQFIFFNNVLPEIKKGILVTAGNSSAFTSSGILAIISIALFFFYDYASAVKANTVFFNSINND